MKVSSSLCQRCKVLQFNDEEHGAVKEWKWGRHEVIFDKFDPEGPRFEDKELRTQAIFLDYDLFDYFPDLPVLSASSASGCGMCFAIREKIIQLERRAHTKHKSVLICKFCFRYTLNPCRNWLRIQRAPVLHPLSDKGRAQLRKLAKKSYKTSKDAHLPTRVIDVGYWVTRSKMRLVVNRGSHKWASRGKYVALSYCWGSEEDAADQLKTTKASLCENMKEIKMESLPKTVSDAVLVCRAMRVRYLWVDALCIIQDSQDDWERESAKMAGIYENSYFTLFPFQSTLNPSISGYYYIYHVMGYYRKNPDLSQNHDLAQFKQSPFDCDLKESQWNTRGWTLQEALCSPRLLLFGTRMVHSIVLRLRQSQGGSVDIVSQPWGQNFHVDGCQPLCLFPRGWRIMIERYSARHFSYSSDKLPAISSLARKFASQTKGEYLAGIWSDELAEDLLWAPQGLRTLDSFLTPPEEYLAPSWSWASQCNPIEWPILYDLKPECRIASIRTTTGLDRYGKVQSGFITLQTKVFVIPSSTKMQRRRKASLGNNVEFPYELTSADGEYLAHLRFDWTDLTINDDKFLEAKQETTQLSMVLVSRNDCHPKYPGSHDFDGSWRFLGLLVLPTETSGSYRRAGIFLCGPRDLQGPKFWDGIDTTTITLL
ncbi:HET domain-containing protein [Aspergillus neoniger CBS 115656]|uniref:HET-domain-containing protein n=1 Tax=Aspergillus neoniger (strain CBS 115656) TaxID=1448310 RepID=A0A318Y9D5_ASPNB|nr:HET-domain-containing protein [Aspergillus neoniger CBS 115656]PYH30925.1 HET-domain-containing protein [Aspergillus neoniger CBS 115656]